MLTTLAAMVPAMTAIVKISRSLSRQPLLTRDRSFESRGFCVQYASPSNDDIDVFVTFGSLYQLTIILVIQCTTKELVYA
jgi:hypothetical protein